MIPGSVLVRFAGMIKANFMYSTMEKWQEAIFQDELISRVLKNA